MIDADAAAKFKAIKAEFESEEDRTVRVNVPAAVLQILNPSAVYWGPAMVRLTRDQHD